MQRAKRRYRHWGRQEDAAIASMFPEYSDEEIAVHLNVGVGSIRKRRHLMGLLRSEPRGGHECAYPDDWQADARQGSAMLLDALRSAQ